MDKRFSELRSLCQPVTISNHLSDSPSWPTCLHDVLTAVAAGAVGKAGKFQYRDCVNSKIARNIYIHVGFSLNMYIQTVVNYHQCQLATCVHKPYTYQRRCDNVA